MSYKNTYNREKRPAYFQNEEKDQEWFEWRQSNALSSLDAVISQLMIAQQELKDIGRSKGIFAIIDAVIAYRAQIEDMIWK